MNDDEDDEIWRTCPVCRRRPTSLRVSTRDLPRHLPRGWRPVGTQRAVGAWAADLPCCIECGTCWCVWHDADAGLLEATAPLPEAAMPLLSPAAALMEVLPALRLRRQGTVPSWVQERIDALFVAWFEAAPLPVAAAAPGLLHAATGRDGLPAERATALRALTALLRRARGAGDVLEGEWTALLADPHLRTSGPAVIEAFRDALAAGLAPPPVLHCPDALRAHLATLLERHGAAPPRRPQPDLGARIRRAFRARY